MNQDMTHIESEKATVECMIKLYCRKNHKTSALCQECRKLMEYAEGKLESCRYGEQKSTCRKCQTHCYVPIYRDIIRDVMRFSGPRMVFCYPLFALKHLIGK